MDDLIDVIEGNRRYVKCEWPWLHVSMGRQQLARARTTDRQRNQAPLLATSGSNWSVPCLTVMLYCFWYAACTAGLYVYNKIDVCSMEEVDEMARRPHSIPISCYQKLNFDGLLARIWDMMVGPGDLCACAYVSCLHVWLWRWGWG